MKRPKLKKVRTLEGYKKNFTKLVGESKFLGSVQKRRLIENIRLYGKRLER